MTVYSWDEVVEHHYGVNIKGQHGRPAPCDQQAVDKFHLVPPNWSIDHDEDLAQFLCANTDTENENLGAVKNYVESVNVSTYSVSTDFFYSLSMNCIRLTVQLFAPWLICIKLRRTS